MTYTYYPIPGQPGYRFQPERPRQGRNRGRVIYRAGGDGGDGGGGGRPGPGPGPPDPAPRDWMAEARALFPWMPEDVLEVYVEYWIASENPNLALAQTRQTETYRNAFPGMVRDDGTLRFETEQQYYEQLRGYGEILFDAGVNPDLFEEQFISLLEGDVTLEEFAGRVGEIEEFVTQRAPEAQQWLAEQYGVEVGQRGLFAMALDPTLGDAVLSNRLDEATIGGEAARLGFEVGRGQAATYLTSGLGDPRASRDFFQTAASQLPALQGLAARSGEADPTVDLEEYSQGVLIGNPEQRRRLRRLLAGSSSRFNRQIGGLRRTQSGALTGLRER